MHEEQNNPCEQCEMENDELKKKLHKYEKKLKKCGKKLKESAKKSKEEKKHGKHKCKCKCKRSEDAEIEETFTLEELAMFNGKNGSPAFVAVNGIVYDVTDVEAWKHGRHYGLVAGKDLSQYFNSCHKNDKKILNKLKVVGNIEE